MTRSNPSDGATFTRQANSVASRSRSVATVLGALTAFGSGRLTVASPKCRRSTVSSSRGSHATASPSVRIARIEPRYCSVSPAWDDPADDDDLIEWAREVYRELEPYASEGVYVNVLGDEGDERIREAYGDHYERLRRIKREWDSDNLFSVNQNIEPADR